MWYIDSQMFSWSGDRINGQILIVDAFSIFV